MKTLFVRLLIALAVVLPVPPAALAQDASIARRMQERVPAIDALKERKVVGENNRGLLEVLGEVAAEEQKLVADENADRTAVYEAIARREGTTADAVGRARARQIAERSRPGVMLQGADGRWAEKR